MARSDATIAGIPRVAFPRLLPALLTIGSLHGQAGTQPSGAEVRRTFLGCYELYWSMNRDSLLIPWPSRIQLLPSLSQHFGWHRQAPYEVLTDLHAPGYPAAIWRPIAVDSLLLEFHPSHALPEWLAPMQRTEGRLAGELIHLRYTVVRSPPRLQIDTVGRWPLTATSTACMNDERSP